MSSSPAQQQPSPVLFFQTINAYQRTEALKAAIELEVFTAIGEGKTTADKIAERCKASERGTRGPGLIPGRPSPAYVGR